MEEKSNETAIIVYNIMDKAIKDLKAVLIDFGKDPEEEE